MAKATNNYQDAECEEKQPPCTDMAGGLLENLIRMRDVLDAIEGVCSERGLDKDPGTGALPLLELQLAMACRDAESIIGRLGRLADRI